VDHVFKVKLSIHSLGGALSLYAAVDLYESDPIMFGTNNTEVYTFGKRGGGFLLSIDLNK
jgi:hypothetical protein